MELLAPAGSMEALRAAVCNGADAVYLGADTFNARMNARNFSAADLQEAVVYCHVRGVKVHLTLNTLVLDREMPRAAELIRLAASCGVDAFIVQDLGVVSLCRQLAPDVPIHASTQMSIHSLEGVMEAAALGCSRVVLARELPAEEIAHICKKSPVEIEVFVHGALCMCYSGQCYLSSVIGRRSGNRGQCAQPCRLPYGYGRFESTRYPLSLKDNCLAGELDELRRIAADRSCKKEFVQKARHTLGYLQLCMDIARGRHADVGALQKDFESSRAPLHRLDVQYRIALALRHRGDRTGMEKSREYLLENSGGTCYGELARAL